MLLWRNMAGGGRQSHALFTWCTSKRQATRKRKMACVYFFPFIRLQWKFYRNPIEDCLQIQICHLNSLCLSCVLRFLPTWWLLSDAFSKLEQWHFWMLSVSWFEKGEVLMRACQLYFCARTKPINRVSKLWSTKSSGDGVAAWAAMGHAAA